MKRKTLVILAVLTLLALAGCGKEEKKNVSPAEELAQRIDTIFAMEKGVITEQSTSLHPTYGTEKETFTLDYHREGKNVWFTMKSTSTNNAGKSTSVDYENKSDGYYAKDEGQSEYTRLSDPTTESFDGIKEILKTPSTAKADMKITKKNDNTFTAEEKDAANKGKYTFTYTFTNTSIKVVVSQASADGKTTLDSVYEVKG